MRNAVNRPSELNDLLGDGSKPGLRPGGGWSVLEDLPAERPERKLRVLFFVEGFTDIRFVTGLSEICDLSMVVAAKHYEESGLKRRVADRGCSVAVSEIRGGRLIFQVRSLRHLLRIAKGFDVILAQEVLRGALNANIVGWLRNIPVVTYMGVSPLEYFRCRYERGQIGAIKAATGDLVIRCMMAINGRLASRCLAMGSYLQAVASRYCRRSYIGLYYGVDTTWFRPATAVERFELRIRLGLPLDKFIVLFSSRISHEKDPETVLKAVAIARSKGLDAIVINLGGGYREFVELARRMMFANTDKWVTARPAAHPMTEVADFFRAADMLAQASLAEGGAFSTLEALACGLPVVATAVGGMAESLRGYGRLVPRQSAEMMAEEIMWIAANAEQASAQALEGRQFVAREWSREKAFGDLLQTFRDVSGPGGL